MTETMGPMEGATWKVPLNCAIQAGLDLWLGPIASPNSPNGGSNPPPTSNPPPPLAPPLPLIHPYNMSAVILQWF